LLFQCDHSGAVINQQQESELLNAGESPVFSLLLLLDAMNEEWWESPVCWLCDYWWALLLALVLGLSAFFSRAYWLPAPVDLCFSGEASVPLQEAIPPRFWTERFGLMGFSDYIDFPYRLYQPLTADSDAVQSAIDALTLADGGDIPEAYGRVMYESVADPNVGWEADAKRYLVIFGDSYPHDPDPGRDELLGTDDDLRLDDVLAQMKTDDITLIFVANPGVADSSLLNLWREWANTTAGTTITCANAPGR
jgi:hypothetical protein